MDVSVGKIGRWMAVPGQRRCRGAGCVRRSEGSAAGRAGEVSDTIAITIVMLATEK